MDIAIGDTASHQPGSPGQEMIWRGIDLQFSLAQRISERKKYHNYYWYYITL